MFSHAFSGVPYLKESRCQAVLPQNLCAPSTCPPGIAKAFRDVLKTSFAACVALERCASIFARDPGEPFTSQWGSVDSGFSAYVLFRRSLFDRRRGTLHIPSCCPRDAFVAGGSSLVAECSPRMNTFDCPRCWRLQSFLRLATCPYKQAESMGHREFTSTEGYERRSDIIDLPLPTSPS